MAALVEADLDLLAQIDRAPAASAFALRNLDTLDLATNPLLRIQLTGEHRVDALSAARLNDPAASPRGCVGVSTPA